MSTTDASQIHDLRSALDFLREMPGQLLETDTQVDPDAEVSGVYCHVGAGGTVMRPTKEGPAMVFNNVKGFDDAKVCIGMLASRKRVAALLDLDEEHLGLEIGKRFENLIAPSRSPRVRTSTARRSCTRRPTSALTCARSFPPPPTRPSTAAPTSPWASPTARAPTAPSPT